MSAARRGWTRAPPGFEQRLGAWSETLTMDRATRRAWHAALVETDPAQKCAQVAELQCAMAGPADADSRPVPGRPPRPLLVHPHDVPQRALGSVEGRAALVHAKIGRAPVRTPV